MPNVEQLGILNLGGSELIISAIQNAILTKFNNLSYKKDNSVIEFFKKRKDWNLYHVINATIFVYDERVKKDYQKEFFDNLDKSELNDRDKKQIKQALKKVLADKELLNELRAFLLIIEKISEDMERNLFRSCDRNNEQH